MLRILDTDLWWKSLMNRETSQKTMSLIPYYNIYFAILTSNICMWFCCKEFLMSFINQFKMWISGFLIETYLFLKRFMSVFCKRRGADDFFLMVNLPAVSVFTFYLFWVKAPLSQHRPALLCSKMEVQILHEN